MISYTPHLVATGTIQAHALFNNIKIARISILQGITLTIPMERDSDFRRQLALVGRQQDSTRSNPLPVQRTGDLEELALLAAGVVDDPSLFPFTVVWDSRSSAQAASVSRVGKCFSCFLEKPGSGPQSNIR